MLPNFVIVGAQRSGSSSLYHYLRQHPDVFMAPGKELRFFNRNFERGFGWYEAHFENAGQARAIGEATPSYMYDPVAVARMAKAIPTARLVTIIRNPVARAYSHYLMLAARGREKRSFEEAVTDEQAGSTLSGFLDQSRYLHQLERLAEYLPRAPLCVLITERFQADPVDGFKRLCQFLEINQEFAPPDLGRKVNRYVEFRSLGLRRIAHSFRPGSIRRGLDAINTKHVNYPPLDPTLRMRLMTAYADEIEALSRYLGMNLSRWWR